jgi:hypothetical protein
MPKLFHITLGVEPLAVGSTLEALKKMRGVLKIDLDLERAVAKANGTSAPSKKFDDRAEDFILALLKKGTPLGTRVLRDHFADVGRKPGSTSSALNLLKKDGMIKHNENKDWMLTKKAHDSLRWHLGKKKSRK